MPSVHSWHTHVNLCIQQPCQGPCLGDVSASPLCMWLFQAQLDMDMPSLAGNGIEVRRLPIPKRNDSVGEFWVLQMCEGVPSQPKVSQLQNAFVVNQQI